MANGQQASGRNAVSSADVVATQNTLNYALGNLGGRQKSWMAPSMPSASQRQPAAPIPQPTLKRKRGRPPLRTENLTNPSYHHFRPTPSGLQTPATESGQDVIILSNSASPQIANAAAPRPQPTSTAPSPITVLPSPSPSDDLHTYSGQPPLLPVSINAGDGEVRAHARNDTIQGISEPASLRDVLEQQLQQATYSPQQQQHHRENLGSRRSEPTLIEHQRQSPATPSAHASALPISTNQPTNQITFVNPAEIHRSQTRTPLQQGQDRQPIIQGRPQISPQFQALPDPRGAGLPLPLAQSALPNNSARGATQFPSGIPSPVQRIDPPTQNPPRTFTLEDCRGAVEAFLQLHPPTPDSSRDVPRLHVLLDALGKQDWDYVTLHQYYCILDVTPEALPQDVIQHPGLPYARELVRDVLDSNDHLSPALKQFFLNFPQPLGMFAALWPAKFEHQHKVFLRFTGLACNYQALRLSCERRNFPPLVGEMFHDLGISSFVFQQLVFTAILRRLLLAFAPSRQKPHYEARLVDVFLRNHTQFWRIRKERAAAVNYDYDREERQAEASVWGSQLFQLCEEYRRGCQPLPQQHQMHSNAASHLAVQHPSTSRTSRQSARHTALQSNYTVAPQAPVNRSPQFGVYSLSQNQSRQNLTHTTRPPRPVSQVVQQHPAQAQPHSHTIRPNQQNNTQRRPTPFLPSLGTRLPQQRQPNPARFAFHQAHLRSPTLKAKDPKTVLYQYVRAFAKSPSRLTEAGDKIERWKLGISPEQMQSIPQTIASDTQGAPSVRFIDENSNMFRIRCIKWPSTQPPTGHAWATADTAWIPYAYITFNGKPLELRKKLHHGKDLPVDITALIRSGVNEFEIAIMRPQDDTSYKDYLLAIEMISATSHDAIVHECSEVRHLSAAQVQEAITEKLSAGVDDDDDIAIVQSSLTISLIDPFSASKMCDIPARSKACLHNDCFDLETFLNTRERKGDASVADRWKCPICNADARPHHLVVDGFIQSVCTALKSKGLSDVRSIVVGPNGHWEPKIEAREDSAHGHPGHTENEEPSTASPAAETSTIPPDAEVIDLSD